MKVVVIGSGALATGLAGLLAAEADVSRIVVADHSADSLESAKSLVALLGNRRVVSDIRFVELDSGDFEAVRRTIRGSRVVFHGGSPRISFEVLRAALAERVHYLDLYADPYPPHAAQLAGGVSTLRPKPEAPYDAQFDLHEQFEQQGVTALLCAGATPGWTSLVAQKAIDGLDEVEKVIVRQYHHAATDRFYCPVPPESLLTEWLTGSSPMRIVNGVPQEVDPLESEEEFDFLRPLGRRRVYAVGARPESVLIPRFAGKPVGTIECKMGIGIGSLETKEVLIKALQLAAFAEVDQADMANIVEKVAVKFDCPTEFGPLFLGVALQDAVSAISVEVAGMESGRKARYLYLLTSSLQDASAHLPWLTPSAYVAIGGLTLDLCLALMRGQIHQHGVLATSQLSDKDQLLGRMRARGQAFVEVVVRDPSPEREPGKHWKPRSSHAE